jgi:hypothetical protein
LDRGVMVIVLVGLFIVLYILRLILLKKFSFKRSVDRF